jgi:hypothetical protein
VKGTQSRQTDFQPAMAVALVARVSQMAHLCENLHRAGPTGNTSAPAPVATCSAPGRGSLTDDIRRRAYGAHGSTVSRDGSRCMKRSSYERPPA